MPRLQISGRPVEIVKLTLTTAELATVLGLPRRAAQSLITKGQLLNVSADRNFRVDVEEVLRYLTLAIKRDELSSLALVRLTEAVSAANGGVLEKCCILSDHRGPSRC